VAAQVATTGENKDLIKDTQSRLNRDEFVCRHGNDLYLLDISSVGSLAIW
jgi:hypothetical protein